MAFIALLPIDFLPPEKFWPEKIFKNKIMYAITHVEMT